MNKMQNKYPNVLSNLNLKGINNNKNFINSNNNDQQ